MTMENENENCVYEAVVVGAGPAGICVVGNLLEQGIGPILWIDEAFLGGRIERYRDVPGNLKTKKLLTWATSLRPFRDIILQKRAVCARPEDHSNKSCISDRALHVFDWLDPETEFPLHVASDLFKFLTCQLRNFAGVSSLKAVVTDAVLARDCKAHLWVVSLLLEAGPKRKRSWITAKRLILCTGSHPRSSKLPGDLQRIPHIPLDTALSVPQLSQVLCNRGKTTIIAVIGGSHSAVLVLRNLTNLALGGAIDLRIRWMSRHRLRYAEYKDGEYVAFDNTGLKGAAATWALECLEPDGMRYKKTSNILERLVYDIDNEEETFVRSISGSDFVIQATGYERNELPVCRLLPSGTKLSPDFDPETGAFWSEQYSGDREMIPGLFGAGIAFPALITDPKYGHIESSIGFPGFMRAVKGWMPGWLENPSKSDARSR